MTDRHDAEVIAELTTTAQGTREIDDTPFVTLPDNVRVESLEYLQVRPNAHRGHAIFERVESFIEYVNAFKTEASRLYVSEEVGHILPSIRCVIDDRLTDKPSWSAFTAGFAPQPSRQFQAWSKLNTVAQQPAMFANFLMRNRSDIFEPEAAKLIEILRDIRGTANVQFSEAIDNHTGARSHLYAESITLKGGKGDVEIPTGFTIHIPVYERQKSRVKLNCFLNAAVDDGKVRFAFEIDLLDEAIDMVIDNLVADVTKATGLAPFYGRPAQ